MSSCFALVNQYLQSKSKGKVKLDLNQIFPDVISSIEELQVYNWIRFAKLYLDDCNHLKVSLNELDKSISHRTYLVSDKFSLADVVIWASLCGSLEWQKLITDNAELEEKKRLFNICRFYNHINSTPELAFASEILSRHVSPAEKPAQTESDKGKSKSVSSSVSTSKRPTSDKTTAAEMCFEEGGKFEGLEGAKMGEVVVRFPPEASGYLHIGHAKAALLNQHYRDTFNGRLVLRFDDTNPAKECAEFEKAILEDLPRLGVHWDIQSRTSDHFDKLLEYCEVIIRKGLAYVDDTDAEVMKIQREQRIASTCRENTIERNLDWWNEMKIGSPHGVKCCVRAKIDMNSDNGALRDPTIYRCKPEPHVITGTKYKVYPTYDFACPIVDSVEGITHALRTSEYNDRNSQYYWICDALEIRRPIVTDYSRLALQHTLLSKRKLAWFVDSSLVTGWDDPRMPTVQGILRHGLTPAGLRQFVLAQGSSRSSAQMEWDKIWAFNKKVIDPISPRYTALELASKQPLGEVDSSTHFGLVPVDVHGQKELQQKEVPLHPKETKLGNKHIWLGPRIFVEAADAVSFVEGECVTFINWGNILITKIIRAPESGVINRIEAQLKLEDTDYKKTLKVTWLADSTNATNENGLFCPVSCVFYSNLITSALVGKDEDFKQFVNHNSREETCLLGEPCLRTLQKGDIIQLQRRGFYICDEPYQSSHPATCCEYPCVLIFIPDGSAKDRPVAGSKSKAPASEATAKPKTSKQPSSEKAKETVKTKQTSKEPRGAKNAKGDKPSESEVSNTNTDKPIKNEIEKSSILKTTSKSSILVEAEIKSNSSSDKQKSKETSQETSLRTKKQTRLGLEFKKEDLADWYSEVIIKSELLEYYDVSGCYILRPWAYSIWQVIQQHIDDAIREFGVENAYFPMFVTQSALEREKAHIADFAPEVAWVTHSGSSALAEPVAIRPTSETIMYPSFAKWIKSHRDLPIKINQWSNVVRWEFKHPQPFLRTREFLWQEGHTAYSNKESAIAEVYQILDLYREVYEDLLAVPVIKGRKTEKEKFAGGEFTTTVEALICANGRAIQGATSHHLGDNFAKMFDVTFLEGDTQQARFVQQNSWGLTTRTLGVMVMVHGDDRGLVLPPRIARYQIVVVPCGLTAQATPTEHNSLMAKASELTKRLKQLRSPRAGQFHDSNHSSNIRVYLDDRQHVSPGWKFNHWELKGVPIRLEIGPKDIAVKQVTLVIRHNATKLTVAESDLDTRIPSILDDIHAAMFTRQRNELLSRIKPVTDIAGLILELDRRCICISPFCGDSNCEDQVKEVSANCVQMIPGQPSMGAKSLCIPFEDQLAECPGIKCGPCPSGTTCINAAAGCNRPASYFTLFGRSY